MRKAYTGCANSTRVVWWQQHGARIHGDSLTAPTRILVYAGVVVEVSEEHASAAKGLPRQSSLASDSVPLREFLRSLAKVV
jgi:hypothetical protein